MNTLSQQNIENKLERLRLAGVLCDRCGAEMVRFDYPLQAVQKENEVHCHKCGYKGMLLNPQYPGCQ